MNFATALICRPTDGLHTNQPKPVKFPAESKFAWKNTKKQMSWIKLYVTEKNWQIYHAENLSLTHFASRKLDLANQSAASSQKIRRLQLLKKQRIRLVERDYESKSVKLFRQNAFNKL